MFALAVLLGVGNLTVTLLRSTIPIAIDGTVTRIEVRPEAHSGVDDVHLLSVDGRTIVVDRAVVQDLQAGDTIRKDAWSTTLETPRGTKRLHPSRDVWAMAIAMPLVVAVAAAMLRWRRRGEPPARSSAPTA